MISFPKENIMTSGRHLIGSYMGAPTQNYASKSLYQS